MPLFLSTLDADFETSFAALLGMKREEAEDRRQSRLMQTRQRRYKNKYHQIKTDIDDGWEGD